MRIAGVALVMLAVSSPAIAEPMGGAWRGVGLQAGPSGMQSTWTIEMTIGPRGGRIDYPSLSCGGDLRETLRRSDRIEFAETITYGPCVTGGRITVEQRDGKLYWFWRIPGDHTVDASAVLYRPARVS